MNPITITIEHPERETRVIKARSMLGAMVVGEHKENSTETTQILAATGITEEEFFTMVSVNLEVLFTAFGEKKAKSLIKHASKAAMITARRKSKE